MLLLFVLLCTHLVYGQKTHLPLQGRFILYLWYKPVGEETYNITRLNQQRKVDIDFKYEDRGASVPSNSHLTLAENFAPSLFTLKGKLGRFSYIQDSMVVEGERLAVFQRDTAFSGNIIAHSFPHYVNSPASLYLLLLKYWEANGRPAIINCLPENTPIHISYTGKDSFFSAGHKVVMHRYRMEREKFMVRYLWIDEEGGLAGFSAGFMSTVSEKYTDLLHDFRTRTAKYTLKEFPAPSGKKDLVIRNARLLDMETGSQLYPAVVIVKNGGITWAGPAAKAVIPGNTKVLDAAGMTLLPGLWDMHQHYYNPMLGPALIGMGITSVRDCANQTDFLAVIKGSIDRGESMGPNIYRAGLIDGRGPRSIGIVIAGTPEEGRARVRQYKKEGFDQVKIYDSVDPDVLKAICDEAKKLGLPVTGHVPVKMNVQAAIDSGMNQISHINNILYGFDINTATYTLDFDRPLNRELLRKMKEKKIVLDGTFAFYELIRRNLDDDIRNLYPGLDSWPEFMQTEIWSMGAPADTVTKYRNPMREKMYKAALLRFFQESIPIVAGTDLHIFPGYTLYRELQIYVSAGLTPLQALQTATTIPAKVMGRSAGIRAGSPADMILVEGDPLRQIEDIQKIRWVIKAGQVYDAPAIRKSIGFKQ
jgi:imidazolonepropionase-like amidohydrolase